MSSTRLLVVAQLNVLVATMFKMASACRNAKHRLSELTLNVFMGVQMRHHIFIAASVFKSVQWDTLNMQERAGLIAHLVSQKQWLKVRKYV